MTRPIVEHVELIGAQVPERLPDAPPAGPRLKRAGVVVAVLLLGASMWLSLERTTEGSGADGTAAAPPTSSIASPTGSENPLDGALGSTRWPSPPRDHDPHVIRRPGPGEPIIADATGLSLVYVNSLGRPTVVDLGTGAMQEVDVAASRSYDAFAIEAGEVVSLLGTSASQRPAGVDAIVFHVYRSTDADTPAAVGEVPLPGPRLCLTAEPCGALAASLPDSTSRFVPVSADDHPAIVSMLSGEGWQREKRWLVEPSELGFDYRLPLPLDTAAWIIEG